MNELNKTLVEIYWKELEKEEGITKSDIDLVDLEIAFSPVTPFKGSRPMEVIELENGMYRIPDCPEAGINISAEALKVMRYRYLQFDPDRVRQRERINRMFGK